MAKWSALTLTLDLQTCKQIAPITLCRILTLSARWIFSSFQPRHQHNHHFIYNPLESPTAQPLSGPTWTATYGDGSSVSGLLYNETISLDSPTGEIIISNHTIGLAANVSRSIIERTAMDGILGLGFPVGSKCSFPSSHPASEAGTDKSRSQEAEPRRRHSAKLLPLPPAPPSRAAVLGSSKAQSPRQLRLRPHNPNQVCGRDQIFPCQLPLGVLGRPCLRLRNRSYEINNNASVCRNSRYGKHAQPPPRRDVAYLFRHGG